ncbi:MAG: hypothetical protein IKY92_09105 [Akkermansia sp.]|nr:hypothetical protein [Akkermansia sp.]
MKHFLTLLLALVCILPAAGSKIDANQLIGGLLNAISEPQEQAPTQSPQKANTENFGDSMASMARAAAAPLIDTFKDECREYAKEVGDIITERILESRKISDTLDSMRIFCWAVVVYLTIVTILIVVLLLRLRVLYSKLMKAIQGLPSNK